MTTWLTTPWVTMIIPACIMAITTIVLLYLHKHKNYERVNLRTWYQLVIVLAALTTIVQEWGKNLLAPDEIVGMAAALCLVLRKRYAGACFMVIAVGLGMLYRVGISDLERIPLVVAVIAVILIMDDQWVKLYNKTGNSQAHNSRN